MGLSWGNSIKNFQNLTKKTSKNVEKEMIKLVEKTGLGIYTDAKRGTPKETGRLRNSWKKKSRRKKKQFEYIVSNPVEYGIYIERGSRKSPPRRMLLKAFNSNVKKMKKGLKQIMKKESNKWQQ